MRSESVGLYRSSNLVVWWSTSGVASEQQAFQQGHAVARCLKQQCLSTSTISPLHKGDLVFLQL